MNKNTQNFEFLKYGLFVHYVHNLSFFSDGRKPEDINETLENFDVKGFAEQIAEMKVQYLIITSWHYNTVPLYPSEVNAKWRNLPIARRDLLGEIIDELNEKDIKVILYTHPRDGHDFTEPDRTNTGWGKGHRENTALDSANPDTFNYELWNSYVTELFEELADRYAKKIYGFYTDGMGPQDGRNPNMEKNFQIVNYLKLRDIMKSRNPKLIMIQNYFGYMFSNDYAMPEGYFGAEVEPLLTGALNLPAAQKALAMSPFGESWMPTVPLAECNDVKVTYEGALRFLLFNASCTVGGGVCYSTGPYCEGNIWPKGHFEFYKTLGKKLEPYREYALNSKPSISYPTISGQTLEDVCHRFFFTSKDESKEYMFLTKMQNFITLPESQDGAKLFSPVSLTKGVKVENFDGATLSVTGDFEGVAAIISFERENAESPKKTTLINNTDKRIRYSEEWEYNYLDPNPHTQYIKGAFECDVHRAVQGGATAFIAFEGSFLELYGKGEAEVFIDGIPVAKVDSDKITLLCRTQNLYGGMHTLYIKAEKEFCLDALKIEG